ncbi:hypothetical protein CDAR_89301 [Caerostris darwini]|uniref:Uncharacterized protein n=1 Tax=Caerostris darwini TaxID=1538125 RepID=A0AAV4UHG4_9ARAC|nr:hypothetical protein CDAR_89301 [Caerostris darwini]
MGKKYCLLTNKHEDEEFILLRCLVATTLKKDAVWDRISHWQEFCSKELQNSIHLPSYRLGMNLENGGEGDVGCHGNCAAASFAACMIIGDETRWPLSPVAIATGLFYSFFPGQVGLTGLGSNCTRRRYLSAPVLFASVSIRSFV